MEIFFEEDGKKYRALEVNRDGEVISADELPEVQFEDLSTEEKKDEQPEQEFDLTIPR